MLSGKKILLGITGSIAAYKSILLLRALIKAGAEVKVLMTPSAKDFISPLTLSTLSKFPVLIDLFDEQSWANHVQLGRWAEVMIIAPLSCNTLSKMANGGCDNLLLAVYLSATCPVIVAPAMDEDMWHHPATQQNLERIERNGCHLIDVGNGELASGLFGEGRMAEPEAIIEFLIKHFSQQHQLTGRKALVSAGPTYEAIDPVRFIGNHSSGKMGYAIAEELAKRGAEVVLVSGPVNISITSPRIEVIKVTTAEEMYDACMRFSENYDMAIMAAAVADYTPVQKAEEKIKKYDGVLTIDLKKTKDILHGLGERKTENQVLVGFALETNNEEQNAKQKLKHKNADMIVLNSLNDADAGFQKDTNKVTIFKKDDSKISYEAKTKALVAKDIVDCIIEILP